MGDRVLPSLDVEVFVCPFCNNSAQQRWLTHIQEGDPAKGISYAKSRISTSRCILCNENAIWVGHKMVWPLKTSREPIPPEVTDAYIVEDYNEACVVLPFSPKASAALSRRCLQYILVHHLGAPDGNLGPQISWVLKNSGLPSHLSDRLNYVQWVGNFAAHSIKDQNTGAITSVEDQEAEWNLTVLESLFDFVFVQPARAKAQKDALNQKLAAANRPLLP